MSETKLPTAKRAAKLADENKHSRIDIQMKNITERIVQSFNNGFTETTIPYKVHYENIQALKKRGYNAFVFTTETEKRNTRITWKEESA